MSAQSSSDARNADGRLVLVPLGVDIAEVDAKCGHAAVVLYVWLCARGRLEEGGRSWHSIESIAEKLKWSERAVLYARSALVEAGFVEVKRQRVTSSITIIKHWPHLQEAALPQVQEVAGAEVQEVAPDRCKNLHVTGAESCMSQVQDLAAKREEENKRKRTRGTEREEPVPPRSAQRATTEQSAALPLLDLAPQPKPAKAPKPPKPPKEPKPVDPRFPPDFQARILERHRVAFRLSEQVPVTKGLTSVLVNACKSVGIEDVLLAIDGAASDQWVRANKSDDLAWMLRDQGPTSQLAKNLARGRRGVRSPSDPNRPAQLTPPPRDDAEAERRRKAREIHDLLQDIDLFGVAELAEHRGTSKRDIVNQWLDAQPANPHAKRAQLELDQEEQLQRQVSA